jgi:hypothetical protein
VLQAVHQGVLVAGCPAPGPQWIAHSRLGRVRWIHGGMLLLTSGASIIEKITDDNRPLSTSVCHRTDEDVAAAAALACQTEHLIASGEPGRQVLVVCGCAGLVMHICHVPVL